MSVLFLPFPPSVNTYWRHVLMAPKGARPTSAHIRVITSEKGREYRNAVLEAVAAQTGGKHHKLTGSVAVHLFACAPDKRKRDLDNYFKAVLDACTHAYVWNDDSQIKRLGMEWCGLAAKSWVIPATTYELEPGLVALEITPL